VHRLPLMHMIRDLTSEEAGKKLLEHGYNELSGAGPKNIWRIALEVIREPMFLLLIACGSLYMLLGDYREGIVLVSSIVIIIGITFAQYRKTERSLEALRNLATPRALVIRDGKQVRIAGREVVPGDVLVVHEGDRIAADANIVECTHLSVDESLLTGESVPVSKNNEESHNSIFSGTLAVQGSALAIVTATGMQTRFGQIGHSLQGIEEEETRLQKEMKVFIRNLSIIGIFLSISVVVAFYFSRGNFLEALLTGLAASMAILPEEFPVVLTIFLALGAWRLSKKNVLTRKSSAIETLGSATVLCSDKTGTITQNKMMVAAVSIDGAIIQKPSFDAGNETFRQLIAAGCMASPGNTTDPMEKAIFAVHSDMAYEQSALDFEREYNLSKSLLMMTRAYRTNNHTQYYLTAKGAPEAVLSLCGCESTELNKQMAVVHAMASQGYRVIAVAEAHHEGTHWPNTQHGFSYRFLGLLGFEDPIRDEVPQAVAECKAAGIRVCMITGDYPATALAIADKIGLQHEGKVLTGEDIVKLPPHELSKRIAETSVFARVIPEQKLMIVNTLKAAGEIVAMTGDGVNDAPALKAAHIGVAMGAKGTDVAREAASLVLLDDNFASIVAAIRSGRRIFDNLQKAMSYILSIHIPIIALTLIPAFFGGLPVLLFPIHIVFMELIIDPVCSIAFESEQEEAGIMQRPPRAVNETFFGKRKILYALFKGLLLLLSVILVFVLSLNEGHTEGEVRAIAFSTLIIGNIFLILTDLSHTRTFASVFFERSKATLIIIAIATTLLLSTLMIPALNFIFNFEYPGLAHFVPALLSAGSMLLLLEGLKLWGKRGKG
jgi:Ca2+-transporting ATPase